MRTTTATDAAETVAELVARQWGDRRPGLMYGAGAADSAGPTVLSRHRTAQEAAARAALLADLLPPGAEPHVGVLLDNTPEFPSWRAAAPPTGPAAGETDRGRCASP